jgi:O-antigen ligase
LYERLGFAGGSASVTSNYLPLSLSVHTTSIAFLKWAAYGALFLIIGIYEPDTPILAGQRWITFLVVCMIFIGLVEALYGLFGYINNPDALLWFTRTYGIHSNRAAGTYVNANHLAGLMDITIPMTVALLVSLARSVVQRRRQTKKAFIEVVTSRRAPVLLVLLLSVIMMVLALIFSGSRMGQFAFCAGCFVIVVLFVIRLARKGRKKIPSMFLLILTSCISLGVMWGMWKGLDPVIDRWKVIDRDLAMGRSVVWETTKPLIKDFPVVGTGFGTYELAYRRYQPQSLGRILYEHAHNDYLQMLAETGWIGFALWVAFFVFFLVCVIYKWFKNRAPDSIAMGAGGIASTVSILVHSFGEFNLQIPANALLLFTAMAITWRSL